MIAAQAFWLECAVVCDRPDGSPLRLALRMPGPATVAGALQAARTAWADESIDWENVRVGVWGEECARTRVLEAGDRVEMYRALLQDPREARRQRSARSRR